MTLSNKKIKIQLWYFMSNANKHKNRLYFKGADFIGCPFIINQA